jgi:hypothetical protein
MRTASARASRHSKMRSATRNGLGIFQRVGNLPSRVLAWISHHTMPFSRRPEGRGFSPAEIAGSQPLLVSCPSQLFSTNCAGRETEKQLRASCNGGAKAPPFLVRGEKFGLERVKPHAAGGFQLLDPLIE